jgi:hypothetical protein
VTYLEAAVKVLENAKRPMTVQEIVDEALARGLLKPSGKTPQATMSAKLYLHLRNKREPQIRRHAEPGPTRAKRGSVAWSLVLQPEIVTWLVREGPSWSAVRAATTEEEGTHARETAEKYIGATVLFALVLFLVAVSQRFRILGVRVGAIAIALVLLGYALYEVATLPRF